MTILLGSANKAVIKRWEGFLSEKHRMEQAATLREFANLCSEKEYRLFLVHRPLIDMSGFSELAQSNSTQRFFLLSDRPNQEEGLDFLKLGIMGYGNTYMSRGRLNEAVRIITNGGVWLGQKVMQQLIVDSYGRTAETASNDAEKKLAGLTKSERKIAHLVATGQTNLDLEDFVSLRGINFLVDDVWCVDTDGKRCKRCIGWFCPEQFITGRFRQLAPQIPQRHIQSRPHGRVIGQHFAQLSTVLVETGE